MKVAAWASLALALAFWPLYGLTYGLLMTATFPQGSTAQQAADSSHFWFQVFTLGMLVVYLASVWLSGLSFRHARIVASLSLAINIGSMAFVLSVFLGFGG
jgi:hypothetical protein